MRQATPRRPVSHLCYTLYQNNYTSPFYRPVATLLASEAALLVLIGAPRLCRLGFKIREINGGSAEHKLYELLCSSDADSAHSRYNALIRLLVSFERAVECAG